jgi:hypothetical protein
MRGRLQYQGSKSNRLVHFSYQGVFVIREMDYFMCAQPFSRSAGLYPSEVVKMVTSAPKALAKLGLPCGQVRPIQQIPTFLTTTHLPTSANGRWRS